MRKLKDKKLIFIQLNELNFDLVLKYVEARPGLLTAFETLSPYVIESSSEVHQANLEPWIQWVSVYTGKKFEDHKVFRLGDSVQSNQSQIFEKVEELGFRVGAISPMNAVNKLKTACYFIPDPWTKTKPSQGLSARLISEATRQVVNDNSQNKISIKSLFILIWVSIYFTTLKQKFQLMAKILKSQKKWYRAIIFDNLLHCIHLKFIRNNSPDFSTVFFNAGAHIQHHYLANSTFSSATKNPNWYVLPNEDPLLDLIISYDRILQDYLKMDHYQILIATGLSQKVRTDGIYYYRLKDPGHLLRLLGVNFKDVNQGMTRDLVIKFNNRETLLQSKTILKALELNLKGKKEKIFGIIDDRWDSLFVSLTVSSEIDEESYFIFNDTKFMIRDFVSFVALKNGDHAQKGYLYVDKRIKHNFNNGDFVGKIHDVILGYFKTDVILPIK